MTGIEVGLLSLVLILILILSGMYIAVALGLVSFFAVWYLRGSLEAPTYVVTLAASDSLENYIFGVIPLFVLMGLIVSHAQIGKDIYQVANYSTRKINGGLGVATVLANAVFAAITGVSIASASVFTRVAVPEMLRYGYTPRFAVGVVAGSSVLGMLIPPSVMLIVYAIITEQSVAALFKAGIIPGLILAISYIVYIVIMATFFKNYVLEKAPLQTIVQHEQLSRSEILNKTLPLVSLILVVLGGIYGGIFTPTEAGAVGVLGAFLIALLKRRMTVSVFWKILVETGHIVATIMMLIIAATIYSRMLGISGLPNELGDWLSQTSFGFYGIMAIYVILLIILGTILDTTSIILIMVPLFLPVLDQYDINLVWFGIVTIVGAEIGLLTPPLGISCYVIKSTLDDDRVSLFDIFSGAFPFALLMLLVLILLIAFPMLSLLFI